MASEGVLVADSEIQISQEMRSSIREEYGSVPQTDKPTETQKVRKISYILHTVGQKI